MSIKPLFRKDSSLTLRLFIGIILVVGTYAVDRYTPYLGPAKSALIEMTQPLYTLAGTPALFTAWTEAQIISRDDLVLENTRLKAENLVLQSKLQRFSTLSVENVRLRELLNSTKLLESNVLVAEIIAISPSPLFHYVMINKGSVDGVFIGQAVVDANGVFGQVMEVSTSASRILLLTDVRHAIPIQITRNGIRLVAEGTGSMEEISLPNVPLTTDIVIGDVLVTSGLGEVFPLGYPVARVTKVTIDQGQPFATVKAEPYAHLDRAHHVLLLFAEEAKIESQ